MNRRRLMIGLISGAAAVALLWAAFPCFLRAATRWLDVGGPPRRADYVMVLLGEERTRPFVAAALVSDGWARRVLLAEAAPTPLTIDKIIPPNHETVRQILCNRGVPPGEIVVLPGAVSTTHDEAKALALFLKDHPNVRVMVVTSDFHTRRSRWTFARALAGRTEGVSFVSAPTDYFPMDRWWQDQWGLLSIVSEYLKLAFYVVCYGYLGHWLAACCVLAFAALWIRRREARLY